VPSSALRNPIESTPKDVANVSETSKISDLNALLHDFDATTNEILDNIKAATERFYNHIEVLLER
jgi:hypothetical protein